jgi:hypothetical protein
MAAETQETQDQLRKQSVLDTSLSQATLRAGDTQNSQAAMDC